MHLSITRPLQACSPVISLKTPGRPVFGVISADPPEPLLSLIIRKPGVSDRFVSVIKQCLSQIPPELQSRLIHQRVRFILAPTYRAALPWYDKPFEFIDIGKVIFRWRYGPTYVEGNYADRSKRLILAENPTGKPPTEAMSQQWGQTLFHELGHFASWDCSCDTFEGGKTPLHRQWSVSEAFRKDNLQIKKQNLLANYAHLGKLIHYFLDPCESFAEVFSSFYIAPPRRPAIYELFPQIKHVIQTQLPEFLPEKPLTLSAE